MNFQRPFICVILKAYLMCNYVGYYCINLAFKYCNVFIHQVEYTYDARRCLLPPGSNNSTSSEMGENGEKAGGGEENTVGGATGTVDGASEKTGEGGAKTKDPPKDREPSEEEKKLLHSRKVALMVFTKKVNIFRDRLEKGDEVISLKTLYEQIVARYDILENCCIELMSYYSSNNFPDSYVDEALNYSNASEAMKCELLSELTKLELSKSKNFPKEEQLGILKPKFEAIKLPKFDGDIRMYPSFIADFESIGCGNSVAILKQCLGPKALQVVHNRDTDYDEMRALLDEEYGDPRKLVDVVDRELNLLTPIEDNDSDGFLRLIQTVHTGYTDLKKVNLESEISNVHVVNYIQKLIPPDAYKRWVRKSRSVVDKSILFPLLLEFLLKEKKDLEFTKATRGSSSPIKIHAYSSPDSEMMNVVKSLQGEIQQLNSKFSQLESKTAGVSKEYSTVPVRSIGGRWCLVHNFPHHDTSTCAKFLSMSPTERFEFIKSKNCCFNCFDRAHRYFACPKMPCNEMVKSVKCMKKHHALVHDHFVTPLGSMSSNSYPSRANVLLETSWVYSFDRPLKVLWDSGAQGSLITHRKARELGAKWFYVSGPMEGVGGFKQWIDTKAYLITIHDRAGNAYQLLCLGMDEVAGSIGEFDVGQLKGIFPDMYVDQLQRPSGRCDLLVGMDYCWLHPTVLSGRGKLQLMQGLFGFSVRGVPPEGLSFKSQNGPVLYHNFNFQWNSDALKECIDHYISIENAGIQAPVYEVKDNDDFEYELIEQGLRYDLVEKQWIATYPWIKDPDTLPNNFKGILGRLNSTEKRLLSDPELAAAYQNEMDDMIRRGVAKKLNKKDLMEYRGPVHYLAHFSILNPSSSSTPVRIVFDPTTKFMGFQLNTCWAKGPNVVNNLFSVLIRFRRDLVGIAGYISKMYHSVKLELKEQHVHRFLWRDLDVERPPDHYVLTTVTFGDRPSSVLATVAMQYTALMKKSEYPDVVEVVKRDTYVDDLLPNSSSQEEARQLKGNCRPQNRF